MNRHLNATQQSRARQQAVSAKKLIEFVMRTDPYPHDRIPFAFANRTILLIDAHRPNVVVRSEFFET
jgi:hypothetical protein